jgi:transcriptional regulator with XRE-family HTH domain
MTLGEFIRHRRLELNKTDKRFSLRKLAGRMGIEPSYLSKVERGENAPLSEAKLNALAHELGLKSDTLMILCGKIPSDITDALKARPSVLWSLIRKLENVPDETLRMIFSHYGLLNGSGYETEARQAG